MHLTCQFGKHSATGLSSRAVMELELSVEPKKKHNICGCSEDGCKCCDGYVGGLNSSSDDSVKVEDACSPAPCNIANSNFRAGPRCACKDGFLGTISWTREVSAGTCIPAPCRVSNSTREPGHSCRCNDGFQGEISWQNETPSGQCRPAPCKINNSMLDGPDCRCKDSFTGDIVWDGASATGECAPVPCFIPNSNSEPGDSCACRFGFEGQIAWSRGFPSGTCRPAPCDVENSNNASGPDCSCKDGFVGSVVWNGSVPTGSCKPAPCNIVHSNGEPGPSCQCKHGFDGFIEFKGPHARGSCSKLECRGEHSNGKAGPECGCADGFHGTADILNDTNQQQYFQAKCEPAPCGVENSNNASGPDCSCKDGFSGSIGWNGSIPTGRCEPASCKIQDSNEKPGLACTCRDGYEGKITFNGTVAQGRCDPAPCAIAHSNNESGHACECLSGFGGDISWSLSVPSGTCEELDCQGAHANSKKGPACGCADGYSLVNRTVKQEVREHYSDYSLLEYDPFLNDKFYFGSYKPPVRENYTFFRVQCVPAPCGVENSNNASGPYCSCKDGFAGSIGWNGSIPTGSCEPASCKIPGSNERPGLECKCRDGYEGSISWKRANAFGTCWRARCDNQKLPLQLGSDYGECVCIDGYEGNITFNGSVAQGRCDPAPCAVRNSNRRPGRDCKCLPGFHGEIYWNFDKASGTCAELDCRGEHANGIDGPKCSCADGYILVRRVRKEELSSYIDVHDVWRSNSLFERGPWEEDYIDYHDVRGSDIEDGYDSDDDEPEKVPVFRVECKPAPCGVDGSNNASGLECRCKDGFAGSVAWNGSVPTGSCEPARCQIPNSNHEHGLACACSDGFLGNITWNGSEASGGCQPVPCEVQHSDFAAGPACSCATGFFGNIVWKGPQAFGACRPLPVCSESIWYATVLQANATDPSGNACEAGQSVVFRGSACSDNRILWRFAEASPPAKCRWEWTGVDSMCGAPTERAEFVLPNRCLTEAALPRCSEEIVYPATMDFSSSLGCMDGMEHPLVQFRGKQCGYDLIQWEAMVVASEWQTTRQTSQPCASDMSLPCGETPASEQLPNACFHAAEPALFELNASSSRVVKLLNNGEGSFPSEGGSLSTFARQPPPLSVMESELVWLRLSL